MVECDKNVSKFWTELSIYLKIVMWPIISYKWWTTPPESWVQTWDKQGRSVFIGKSNVKEGINVISMHRSCCKETMLDLGCVFGMMKVVLFWTRLYGYLLVLLWMWGMHWASFMLSSGFMTYGWTTLILHLIPKRWPVILTKEVMT